MSLGRKLACLIATIILAWSCETAHAQAPLVCGPQNVGQRVCQAQGICECSQFTGGLMFRDPPGYRWDCSLTRGTCLGNEEMPVLARSTVPLPVVPGGRAAAVPSHDTVRFAQADLKRHGFDPGATDGVLGSRTRAAIAAFQRAERLPATGALDPTTLTRLRT
jgi:hypothetical protein